MSSTLDFEGPLAPLERELSNLRRGDANNGANQEREAHLEEVLQARLAEIYGQLTPWQKVQVARHRERPYTLDYLPRIFSDFVELRGDRNFADDRAIVAGPALLDGRTVMVIGHQKGRDTRQNVERNFGMPHPEGYRKAERLMRQAERMNMPIITFVDTPGANPALMDEERGQAEAIASSIATLLAVSVPTIAVVTGEGGSGGALAISVADRILMLEHSVFTVASPEAAAAILWHDSAKAPDAAQNMKITAEDLKGYELIDHIVPEPVGGAHRDYVKAAELVAGALLETLAELDLCSPKELLDLRYRKYRDIGFYQQ